jgi:hypothetical protein
VIFIMVNVMHMLNVFQLAQTKTNALARKATLVLAKKVAALLSIHATHRPIFVTNLLHA